jgi:hypothetical protein
LHEEYGLLAEIVRIAEERNIPIHQPFAGQQIGPRVLSPGSDVYPLLLPQFDRTPEADQAAIKETGYWIGKGPTFMDRMVEKVASKIQKWVAESWEKELLRDGGCTSASNESSVVLYGDFGKGRRVLFSMRRHVIR